MPSPPQPSVPSQAQVVVFPWLPLFAASAQTGEPPAVTGWVSWPETACYNTCGTSYGNPGCRLCPRPQPLVCNSLSEALFSPWMCPVWCWSLGRVQPVAHSRDLHSCLLRVCASPPSKAERTAYSLLRHRTHQRALGVLYLVIPSQVVGKRSPNQ